MKAPGRKRRNPKTKKLGPAPAGVDLEAVASRAVYAGSPYHKDVPSFAGLVPRPRPNASICPRRLAWQQEVITGWLRDAIRNGWFSGAWVGPFPTYVWIRRDAVVYEARLTGTSADGGQYHGYPLEADQEVKGLP